MSAWRVPSGSVLLSVGGVLVTPEREPYASVKQLEDEVARVIERGEMIPVMLDAPDGSRLHRYISPFIRSE